MQRFIQQLIASLALLNVVKRCKNKASLLKIKAAQAYVLGIKKLRIFFLGIVFVSIAFVLLVNGLSLIESAAFTYSMWSNETKFVVALILGGIEFLGAAGILVYLFREETWGNFSEVNKVLNAVIEEKAEKES